MMSKLRIAIIGAGPSGLSQLLAFKQAEEEQKVEVTCFEKQSKWGGLWIYNSHIGVDHHGEPVHSSMYRQLWINNPKEIMEYPDYTFYDHFGCFLPSFLPRACIYDYLTGRATRNNLQRFIRFNTAVRHVDFDEEHQQFSVDVEDFNSDSIERLTFDRVIVATGRYHAPNMISIDGIDQFPGRVLHSHDFRGAEEFVDCNVLLIGGRMSAEDIALHCYKFGARSVTISSRGKAAPLKWPAQIKTVSMVMRVDGRTAHFQDGSKFENIDAIIFCTGYRQPYPFLAKQFRFHCDPVEFIPPNLYKSIFWNDQPYLAYVGTTRYIYTFCIFEIQAAIVRDVFLGHIKLPDKAEREANINEWRTREKTTVPMHIYAMTSLQSDYIRDILALLYANEEQASLPKFDFDEGDILIKKYLQTRIDDILRYRDCSFESVVSSEDKRVVEVFKPWIENMDDSMENFLSNYRQEPQLAKNHESPKF